MNGRQLNNRWKVGVKHSLYRESGDWYHQLKRFPGAFFDKNGYVIFNTEEEYRSCPYLQIKRDVHVPSGISDMPNYVRVIINGEEVLPTQSTNVGEKETYYEGKLKEVILTKYERDPKARAKCLETYGTNCTVCMMNFKDKYGEIAQDIIHVHHLTPLAVQNQEHIIDPIKDLRPVCPNCHSVIHKRNPPFSIQEVRAKLLN